MKAPERTFQPHQKVTQPGRPSCVLLSRDSKHVDRTKDGYDIEIKLAVANAVKIRLDASGGCGSPEHISTAVLAANNLHYGQYTIIETKKYLRENVVPVRITV